MLGKLLSVSGMTLISRLLGYARDTVTAYVFGTGAELDAFIVAFRIPNFLRRIFAEGAFSQAFVPILMEYKSKSPQEVAKFIANIAGILILVLSLITAIGMIFANTIIDVTAPGFMNDPYKFQLTVHMLYITFGYILFISLTSLVGSILNAWNIFAVPAFTPTILNVSFIIFILFLNQYFDPPILSLAYAVLVGGAAQLLFQLPHLHKINLLIKPTFDFKNSATWRVIRLMGPAIFATSAVQVSIVINTMLASLLPNGSISWLFFADRLMEFPTGVFGVALGTILLPQLSKHAIHNNWHEFSQTLDWGLKIAIMIVIPASIGLALIAKPLITVLFMHGKFNSYDVIMTQHALIAYTVGLFGLITVKILSPAFYAQQNIKTPVKIAVLSLCCTQIMNLILIKTYGHVALALAISTGAWINVVSLWYILLKRKLYTPSRNWSKFLIKIILANLILAICIICMMYVLRNAYDITKLAVIVTSSALIYFITLYALNIKLWRLKEI